MNKTKIYLFLLLLTLITCKTETKPKISKIGELLNIFNSDEFFSLLTNVIDAIKAKDFNKILNSIYSFYQNIKKLIQQKNETKNQNEDEVVLQYPRVVLTLYTIIKEEAFDWYEKGGLELLKKNCFTYYGQTTWFCKLIP